MYTITWIVSLLTICCYTTNSNQDFYSATDDLKRGVERGFHLANLLDSYLEFERARLHSLDQLAERLKVIQLVDQSGDAIKRVYYNPINAYVILDRLAINWNSFKLNDLDGICLDNNLGVEQLNETKLSALYTSIHEASTQIPTKSHVDGAGETLLRLQEVFRLETVDIVQGRLLDNNNDGIQLTSSHCLHLAKIAFAVNKTQSSIDWYIVAYQMLKLGADLTNETTLQRPSHMSRQEREAILVELENYLVDLGIESDAENLLRLIKSIVKNNIQKEFDVFNVMCKSPSTSESSQSSLRCRHYIPHPYYLIGPVREEVLSLDPLLVMWYDVMHPREIEWLQKVAKPRMSEVEGGETVFTQLGINIKPVKGGAAFWWNLHHDGKRDSRTIHGACPVNSGSKWIITLWFREFGQEFIKPCYL